MRNRLLLLTDTLQSSYWFIPSIMAVLAAVLSIITIWVDERLDPELVWITGLTYVNSPEGGRQVLSTIASSMITVAGVVFSLTMVVLSLTSQQYGPLVIRNFIRDRGNQMVLGTFTATFIYCLLILRTVRGTDDGGAFVPHVSLLTGLALAILSLAVLIYFIHHVSETIQAANIIARISDDLEDAIDEWFPATLGRELKTPSSDVLKSLQTDTAVVPAVESGYVQAVDEEALLNTASHWDIVITIKHRPGEFIIKGEDLVMVTPQARLDDEITEHVLDAFVIGSYRTTPQDFEFIFMQMVGIAVRALSPGLNDPFTAVMCIDRLGEALCMMAGRQPPSVYRYDDRDTLRVIAVPYTFEQLFMFAFDQIRYYGQKDNKVVIRLLQMIATLARCSTNPAHHQLFQNYAEQLYQQASQNMTSGLDQAQLDRAFQNARQQFAPAVA